VFPPAAGEGRRQRPKKPATNKKQQNSFPFEPPKVSFDTRVYHPNIDARGRVCLDLLDMPPKGSWRPSLTLATVLAGVRQMLAEPNPRDPLEPDVTEEYLNNRSLFELKARQMVARYAAAPPPQSAAAGAEEGDGAAGAGAAAAGGQEAAAAGGAGGGEGGGGRGGAAEAPPAPASKEAAPADGAALAPPPSVAARAAAGDDADAVSSPSRDRAPAAGPAGAGAASSASPAAKRARVQGGEEGVAWD
jgi:hypothetical protein